MPFRSKQQAKYMYAAAARGEISQSVVDEFASKTDFKSLPERVHQKNTENKHNDDGQHYRKMQQNMHQSLGPIPKLVKSK